MKIEVRYLSKSGNTEKIAKAIAEAAGVTAKPITDKIDSEVDILFLGGAVYAFGIDNELKNFISTLNSSQIRNVAIFSTAAVVKSAYSNIAKLLAEKNITVLTREFHCKGEFKFMHKGHPNTADLERAKVFA
ncbi:MAG: flavodoxin, partial [Spirochaetaceae bacterium]|nr:flavodoxin [Spirochaetaceae bacterium]